MIVIIPMNIIMIDNIRNTIDSELDEYIFSSNDDYPNQATSDYGL